MKTTNYVAPEAISISIEIEDAVLQESGNLSDIGAGGSLNSIGLTDELF